MNLAYKILFQWNSTHSILLLEFADWEIKSRALFRTWETMKQVYRKIKHELRHHCSQVIDIAGDTWKLNVLLGGSIF